MKGSNCSKCGIKYELDVFNIVSKCSINVNNNIKKFNTQKEIELGRCNSFKNDIECNYNNINDIHIEIKKVNTPDWCQSTIKYIDNRWTCNNKIINDYIKDIKLFNGNIPKFITNNITYDEWLNIKKENKDFNDSYIECPDTIIRDLYKNKGCSYIQVSNKGLYHLGNDICNFNVPEFIIKQKLRIRIKVHSKNRNGFALLSVIISPKPINIKEIKESLFSLDNISKLPKMLIFNEKEEKE